ncbi:hypothetical protein HPB50_021326 [Hyalomma asiaticum]|uniref:Uncharacterized protein n=1 Tax=Hyalomma asiaticum TaxID=266040 RepID=A0ACB7S8G3_HYAAI|nr:hypothetical protein HPB50_021326 [Hyalomma asiaticum]
MEFDISGSRTNGECAVSFCPCAHFVGRRAVVVIAVERTSASSRVDRTTEWRVGGTFRLLVRPLRKTVAAAVHLQRSKRRNSEPVLLRQLTVDGDHPAFANRRVEAAMRAAAASCLLAALVAAVCSTARGTAYDLLGLLDVPTHDGVIRVCRLETSQALVQAAAETSGVTLVVRVSSDAGARKQPCGAEDAFEASQPSVSVITGKVDKTAFDQVHELKVVGFFVNGAADYKIFEEASITEGHHARFYAVFDRTVAKHMKLDTVGQIAMYSPFVKQPVTCPQNPASLQDIRTFIRQHKHVLLTKVDEHNLHDPELVDPSRVTVLAVADQASPLGGYFLRLLHRTLRNVTNTTAAAGTVPHFSLLWVDPSVMPTAHTVQGQWFDMSTLNATGGRGSDEENVHKLLVWLASLPAPGAAAAADGTGGSGTWRFSEIPASQIGAEGGTVELRCTVLDPAAGDCLWLRDGRNVGANLARLPHLSWAGAGRDGDCSLVVRGLTRGRDDGSWVCQVTGDAAHPTLTSPPAVLVISSGGHACATLRPLNSKL